MCWRRFIYVKMWVHDSIATGEIDGAEFADCVIEKKTTAIKFKKIKR